MSMMLSVETRINPYPGLAPFEEQDATRFFGRDREVEEVLNRLANHRLLAVIGVSGCGKSSLVRAGVVPALRMRAAVQLPTPWSICTITPGNDPLAALRKELAGPDVWPSTSFDLVEQARNKLHQGESFLLIVDQFEELFRFRHETLAEDGGNAASLFVNLMLTAVNQSDVPVYVLLTMRADFLGQCGQFHGLPEALNDRCYLVPRLTRLQQQEAIEQPLQEQGAAMQPALVQRLLNDSTEDLDHLPVLQHLLKRLWEKWDERGAGGRITLEDYELVGGWAKALDRDAEAVVEPFGAEQDGIRRLFQWITARGTGEKPVRRPRPFAECIEVSGLDQECCSEVIHAFQKRGLLRPSDLSNPLSPVDLPHECVMWQWFRLMGWIDEDVALATQLRFLLQSAHQKNPLTGLTLKAALDWQLEEKKHGPLALRYLNKTELEQTEAWIVQSEQIEEARQQTIVRNQRREQAILRRRKWIFGCTAVLMLVLAIIAVMVTRHQRNSARAQELSAWSAASIGEDPERSLILGLYAWDKQKTMVPGLEESLHSALLQASNRLTLHGHRDFVLSVRWSPDGIKLATASVDKDVKIWEASTGRELLTLSGHRGAVFSVAWSPDGTKLATASADKEVKIWEASTGRELLTLSGHRGPVFSVAWSPDGAKLATAGADQTARVWDMNPSHVPVILSGHVGSIRSIVWSPDGKKLATASEDGTAKVWDAATAKESLTLRGHKDRVLSVAWSPDGTKLATGSADKTVKLWDAATGQELVSLTGHQDKILGVAWSRDGTKLATASYDKTASVWEVETGEELQVLRGHQAPVWSIAWSPDGSELATASYDDTAKIWHAGLGHELLALEHHQVISNVTWSPSGKWLATAAGDESAVWEAGTGREVTRLGGTGVQILSVAWSPNGSRLAIANKDRIKLWDTVSWRELDTLIRPEGPVTGMAWSPDGTKLATIGKDTTAKVWDLATGQKHLTLSGHRKKILWIAWSPDGGKLATASDDLTGKVWDANTGHDLLTLAGHQGFVLSIAWSPDGSRLATASSDKTARVWDARAGHEIFPPLTGHQDEVLSIAWSPDGSKLATASRDKTEKVWDAAGGHELLTLHGHRGAVLSVAWSPEGKRLASAGDDEIVQVYAIDLRELLRLARSRISRELSTAECNRYLDVNHCPPVPQVP